MPWEKGSTSVWRPFVRVAAVLAVARAERVDKGADAQIKEAARDGTTLAIASRNG